MSDTLAELSYIVTIHLKIECDCEDDDCDMEFIHPDDWRDMADRAARLLQAKGPRLGRVVLKL